MIIVFIFLWLLQWLIPDDIENIVKQYAIFVPIMVDGNN